MTAHAGPRRLNLKSLSPEALHKAASGNLLPSGFGCLPPTPSTASFPSSKISQDEWNSSQSLYSPSPSSASRMKSPMGLGFPPFHAVSTHGQDEAQYHNHWPATPDSARFSQPIVDGHSELYNSLGYAHQTVFDNLQGFNGTMEPDTNPQGRQEGIFRKVEGLGMPQVYVCPTCNLSGARHVIEQHMIQDHPDTSPKPRLQCRWPYCTKDYVNFADCTRHEDIPHHVNLSNGDQMCSFPGCEVKCKSSTESDRHYNFCHRDLDREWYACDIDGCERIGRNAFRRRDHLNEHKARVHKESTVAGAAASATNRATAKTSKRKLKRAGRIGPRTVMSDSS